MAPLTATTLLALLPTALLATPTPKTYQPSDPLPLVIWHGLGDNYKADGLRSVGDLAESINPGTFIYYVRLDPSADSDRTATFLGNLTLQLSQVCSDIASHPILSTAPAINALGFSQGGQFLRGYVERCNTPPVHNLVTFGSQHNGIAKYQECGPSDWLCKTWVGLLKGNTWSNYVQSRLVPAQYFRSVDEGTGDASEEYLEYSNFLADVNNERSVKNQTYGENVARLNKFAMYVFEDDETVFPKETGWFSQVNATSGEVVGLRERRIYKEDWIGLRKLDEKGGLVFKTTKGRHMELGDKVLTDAFREFFSPEGKENEDKVEEVMEL
ncbi:alpha/beta-hydrolase [Aaosphaeria arxii CBS 175.79]|uniref:Palmitoyl-protein thioesterase 1 n=1 Tax=Aaosphaeria arxii CBS 175.79 TaxID=1450172 RepID=A0A6A5XBS9_9PLEO|nr:alpha/beta-hydrolase [Aaosphaeria arxii CBS 175.79]KAF2010418.1 alpha/beta-hydrolase [Aaosphaeria arxii CBS 175.79]